MQQGEDPMKDLNQLEISYQDFIENLPERLPDGITHVDFDIIEQLSQDDPRDNEQYYHFYVVETSSKITLYNEEFAVWVLPVYKAGLAMSYVLIADISGANPHLEAGFCIEGSFNNSKILLKVLESHLDEIKENNEVCRLLEER